MPLAEFLDEQGFAVLDGGLATELERRGADLSDPLWSAGLLLTDPEEIRSVHESYFTAGADVATSASYQASIGGLTARGLARGEAARAIELSVELAREARQRFWESPARPPERLWPLVAGSVGPYGAALADGSEYRGEYGVSRQELADFHGPRLEALIAARPDLLAVETIPSLDEALLVLELLRQWPQVVAWVSFSCRDASRISEGEEVTEAIAAVTAEPQVVAVGFNCIPPALAEPLLGAAAGLTKQPLVVYPNSGERWDAEARSWAPGLAGADFGALALRWYATGARLIGGCCRTTPETIRKIRAALDSRSFSAGAQRS